MALRVTQGMMHSQMLRNMHTNLQRMESRQNVLSTGMKLNKPSDDPVGITYSLRYRSELSSNEQYQRNTDMAKSWLDYSDTVIGQVNDSTQRAYELLTQAVNSTNPQDALDAIKIEMEQINEQLVSLGNSKMNNKYIFNGQYTDTPPYDMVTAATVITDQQAIQYKLADGTGLKINVSGNDIFGNPNDPDNLFGVMDTVMKALAAGDQDTARSQLDNMNSRISKVNEARSEIGAKTNRVDLIVTRLEDMEYNITSMQTKVEDADMAEVILKAQQDESVYQASLATSARIIQNTLLDYLR